MMGGPHPHTIERIADRLRVGTHQAAAFVSTLNECTDDERTELHGFIIFVSACADALSPISTIAAEERETVVVPMLRSFR